MNALLLAMQDYSDPRWMTLRQASNKNGWKVEKGSRGTMISFLKTTDRVQVLDENGKPQLNSRKNPKTDLIKLKTPVEAQAFVFNAEQIEGIPSLEAYLEEKQSGMQLTPSEQLAKLVKLSKAQVEATTGGPEYEPDSRVIFMPEMEGFGSEAQHNAALLYELVKHAGHEKGLYDPEDRSASEQIRPALAALLLGSEIGVESQLAPQLDRAEILRVAKDDPELLEAAANDAQYITDYLTALGNSREQRQGPRQQRFLQVGDLIEHNETKYEVTGKLRGRDLQVEDKSTGNRFKVGPSDGIYISLLSAKNEALGAQRVQEKLAEQEQVMGPEEEVDNSMEHEHADELERENFQGSGPGDEDDEDEDFTLSIDPLDHEHQRNGMRR
jgi:antirestriction protein ArdC